MYKEEFISIGESGTESDEPVYTAQNLTRKLKDHLKDKVTITMLNQRKGNFIHSSDICKEEALSHVYKDAKRCEENSKLVWAALHLTSQIMHLSKTRTPNPATVQNLKECASEIPEQVDLIFTLKALKLNSLIQLPVMNVMHQMVFALIHTVGHTYQNVSQDDVEANSNPIAF